MIHHEGTKDTKGTKADAMVLSYAIVGAAIEVHKHLGSGLLEAVYEAALELNVRLDLLVEKLVVVEVKAVERLLPIHRAQLLTYLRLTCHSVGLLIIFNVELLRSGVKRVLNG